jgi:hypothetical protein
MKYLILPILLFISVVTAGQQKTLRYRATGFALTKFNYKSINAAFTPVDILVVLYMGTNQIKLFNKDMDVFDIISDSENKRGSATLYKYECLDKGGVECSVSFMDWPEGDPAWSVIVDYNDWTYIYKLEVVKD